MYHYMVTMRDGNGNCVKQGFVYADSRGEAIKAFKEKYGITSNECYLCYFEAEKDD